MEDEAPHSYKTLPLVREVELSDGSDGLSDLRSRKGKRRRPRELEWTEKERTSSRLLSHLSLQPCELGCRERDHDGDKLLLDRLSVNKRRKKRSRLLQYQHKENGRGQLELCFLPSISFRD